MPKSWRLQQQIRESLTSHLALSETGLFLPHPSIGEEGREEDEQQLRPNIGILAPRWRKMEEEGGAKKGETVRFPFSPASRSLRYIQHPILPRGRFFFLARPILTAKKTTRRVHEFVVGVAVGTFFYNSMHTEINLEAVFKHVHISKVT